MQGLRGIQNAYFHFSEQLLLQVSIETCHYTGMWDDVPVFQNVHFHQKLLIPRNIPVSYFSKSKFPPSSIWGNSRNPFETDNYIDFVENSMLGVYTSSKAIQWATFYMLSFFQLSKQAHLIIFLANPHPWAQRTSSTCRRLLFCTLGHISLMDAATSQGRWFGISVYSSGGMIGRNSYKAFYSGPEFLMTWPWISRPYQSWDQLELDPSCWPGSSNKVKVFQWGLEICKIKRNALLGERVQVEKCSSS